MRGRNISALGFVAFVVGVHAGCDVPTCPPGEHGPYDNRDRKMFPTVDQDWYCVKVPESVPHPPPPTPPDLGVFKQEDPSGPKDPDAVAKAAIFIESCIHEALDSDFNINSRIDAVYGTLMKSAIEHAISARLSCFRGKTNGCQAVQECLGIAILPHEPAFASGCTNNHIGLRRLVSDSGEIRDLWLNCDDLGYLRCYALPEPWCGAPRGACSASTCHMFEGCPINCAYSLADDKMLGYLSICCPTHGLVCNDDGPEAQCIGSGPACSPLFTPAGEYFADFRSGLVCNDEMNLNACINGHEKSVDCSRLGAGFKCIGGSRPHCALDFQCGYDGTNPLPTCDGPRINICNAGVRTSVDCTSLGFEGCDATRGVCKPKTVDASP